MTRAPAVMALLSLLSLPATTACGSRADLQIVLDRAPGASLTGLDAIRVNVRELARSTPEVFDAYVYSEDQQKTLRTSVELGEPFYVDVWGCETADNCLAADVIARGCTRVMVLEEIEGDLLDAGDLILGEVEESAEIDVHDQREHLVVEHGEARLQTGHGRGAIEFRDDLHASRHHLRR